MSESRGSIRILPMCSELLRPTFFQRLAAVGRSCRRRRRSRRCAGCCSRRCRPRRRAGSSGRSRRSRSSRSPRRRRPASRWCRRWSVFQTPPEATATYQRVLSRRIDREVDDAAGGDGRADAAQLEAGAGVGATRAAWACPPLPCRRRPSRLCFSSFGFSAFAGGFAGFFSGACSCADVDRPKATATDRMIERTVSFLTFSSRWLRRPAILFAPNGPLASVLRNG